MYVTSRKMSRWNWRKKTINNILNSVLSLFNCLFRIYLNRKTPLWVLNLIKIIHLFICPFQILYSKQIYHLLVRRASYSTKHHLATSKQNAEIEVNQFTKCGDIAQRHFHIPKSAILIKSNITCWDGRTWPFLEQIITYSFYLILYDMVCWLFKDREEQPIQFSTHIREVMLW